MRTVLFFSTALVASALASDAVAQQEHQERAVAPQRVLEEVVVTARKRAESLMDVPVAVSALSSVELQRAAADDLTKITQMVPQVEVRRGSYGLNVSIRGIGSQTDDPGVEQTVAINIDGVQISRGQLALLGMFDLEQVEILKGPQALFFGKNSPAGVMSLTSAGPTDELAGHLRMGIEFEADQRYVEFAAGGPISETLGARIALRASTMDGWLKNNANPLPNPYAASSNDT